MRSKKFIIVYAIVLFLIVFLIAFNSVCAITQIDVRFDVSSSEAKTKAERIQDELDGFLKKNFLFFDTGKIEDIFAREENAHFKLLSVKKRFPNKIFVDVCEKYEYYAFYDVPSQKYYITDAAFEVIALSDSIQNNLSGNNIEIKGFTAPNLTVGEVYSVELAQQIYFKGVGEALAYFDRSLGGVRASIVSVTYDTDREGIVSFETQEGVQFYFTNIEKSTSQLFEEVCRIYNGLSDGEKTYGRIMASVTVDGGLNVAYTPKDEFSEN